MNSRLTPRTVVSVLLVAMAFVLSHPYGGIRHDGILYLGEALVRLDPARMADDLFFVFGSQGSFSVVPRLYADAIAWFGVGNAARALLVVTLTAYALAAAWVLRPLMSGTVLFWSFIVVFVGAPLYGGHRVFAYAETFFTARSVAEPIVLLGIGWLIRGRVVRAGICEIAALFIHPLLALPGLVLLGGWLVWTDRRWLWALSFAVIPIGLAFGGVAPFDNLFVRYDADWMSVVEEANPFVFLGNWHAGDWGDLAFDVGVLGWTIAAQRGRGNVWPRFAGAALIAGLAGLAAALVGADLLSNVLLTGLQLWRCQWLMHWAAMVAIVPLISVLWMRETPNDRSAALLLVATIFSLTTFGPLLFVPGAIALVAFRKQVPVTASLVNVMKIICVIPVVLLFVRQLAILGMFNGVLTGSTSVQLARILSMTLVLPLVLFAGLRYLPRRGWAGTAVALLLLGVAVAGWDQREGWTRFEEDYSTSHDLLWSKTVAPSDRVYWFHEIRAPWLVMRHANYYSPNQTAGVLFNRQTALAAKSRREVTGGLEFQETVCRTMNALNKKETSCEPDILALKDICTSPDNVSFVVLQSVLPIHNAGEFRTGFTENGYEKTFYLYRCSDVSAG